MTKPIPSDEFRNAMQERITNRPFKNGSAYKVRESWENIESMASTVTEIISVVSNGETHSPPIRLGCCTSEDKARWLKDLPGNIARELGGNLIPAIEALSVEGVPEATIGGFTQSIKGSVRQLLADCNAIQATTKRSVTGEYARMKAGQSDMLRICNDAFRIANQAKLFCQKHGVL